MRTLRSLAVGLLLGCSPSVEPASCTDGGALDAGADLAPALAPSCPGNPALSCSQKPGEELPGQRCSVSACYCATGAAACCCASAAPDLAP